MAAADLTSGFNAGFCFELRKDPRKDPIDLDWNMAGKITGESGEEQKYS
jgi:hypothetical protein